MTAASMSGGARHSSWPWLLDLTRLPAGTARGGRRLTILMLADDSHPAPVVMDHVRAIANHSHHDVCVFNPISVRSPRHVNPRWFDLVVIHYSLCVVREYFLPDSWAMWVRDFRGPKIQIIQDECRWVDEMSQRIAWLGIDALISSLSTSILPKVYRRPELARLLLASALPGYVPQGLLGRPVRPLAKRPFDIVYRGRDLPVWLGRQAQEKGAIAQHARSLAARHGFRVDIETAEDARIYGADWFDFVASGRCVLAVEGGASIFDFDSSAERRAQTYLDQNPGADFEEVWRAVLHEYEGNVVHRTITPRVFEAIALRTALIMYPGEYRGVVEPWRHYLPLAPDGSNDSEVVRRLRDHDYLEAMAARAYDDVVASGRYLAPRLAEGFDEVVGALLDRRRADGKKPIGSRFPLRVRAYTATSMLAVARAHRDIPLRLITLREQAESRWSYWSHWVSRLLRALTDPRRVRARFDKLARAVYARARAPVRLARAAMTNRRSVERREPGGLEVLLLCDYRRDIAATVADHIDALANNARHHVRMVSMLGRLPARLDLSRFDVIILHYGLAIGLDAYIDQDARERIAAFSGLKVAFIQDEYRWVDRSVAAMRSLGIELLFTCVPESEIEKVYPRSKLPGVRKVNVLTGYVPDRYRGHQARPYESRPIDVGYRGRDVPAWLGALGQEKENIGLRFAKDAPRWGLVVDISTKEADRLYGDRWTEFLERCKAVLGVESGASVFDFTGEIQSKVDAHVARNPEVSFETLQRLYFRDLEDLIDLKQISPRCFEAAAHGALMVLYEGRYSGILEPWRHFVPLRKDHSNMDEVVSVIRNPARASAIIECVRREVVENPVYSFSRFSDLVATHIDECILPHHRAWQLPYQDAEFDRVLRQHAVVHVPRMWRRRFILTVWISILWIIDRLVPAPHREYVKGLFRRSYHFVANPRRFTRRSE